MANNEIVVYLDGATDQLLDIDAAGVSVTEHPFEVKGSGYTEQQIKAMTNIMRNWAYVDVNQHIWMCTHTIGEADPTAWVMVDVPIDLNDYVEKVDYNADMAEVNGDIVRTTSYVICGTSASTTAKTVSLTGFTLETGATVRVKFSNTNTASNPTLNVNSTGAKPIYANTGEPIGTTPDTAWAAGEIVELVYDGTNWVRPSGAVGSIGSLEDLETTDKSTIVAALNEVNGLAVYSSTSVGDMAELETTEKSSLVEAINEVNAETDVIDKLNAVVVVTPSFSSLPQTFTDQQLTFENGSHITPDLICGMYDFRLSNQSVMLPPWTVNTEVEGQLTISGAMAEGSTTVKLYLHHKDVAPPEGGASSDYLGVHGIVKVTLTDITSLPVTFTGLTGVTAQHEALVENYGVITPKSSANGDWSFTCGTESVTISGTFNGSTPTTVKLTLCIPDNKITSSATGGE